MKKLIILAIVIVVAAVCFFSFGQFTCDRCKEEKFGLRETREFLGKEYTLCKDCAESPDALDDLGERVEDGIDELGDKLNELEDLFK